MPDIGMPPPPPPDVASQMKPSVPPMDLGALISQFAGQPGNAPTVDISGKVMQLEPSLTELALQAPALAPDVSSLMNELKSRMGGTAQGMANMVNPAMSGPGVPPPAPTPGAPPIASLGGMTPDPVASVGGPMAPMPPAATALPAVPEKGVMDLAMDVEITLPEIGKDDPTLMPQIQHFIARMREEVPKVIEGSQNVDTTINPAPDDAMMKQMPVTA